MHFRWSPHVLPKPVNPQGSKYASSICFGSRRGSGSLALPAEPVPAKSSRGSKLTFSLQDAIHLLADSLTMPRLEVQTAGWWATAQAWEEWLVTERGPYCEKDNCNERVQLDSRKVSTAFNSFLESRWIVFRGNQRRPFRFRNTELWTAHKLRLLRFFFGSASCLSWLCHWAMPTDLISVTHVATSKPNLRH